MEATAIYDFSPTKEDELAFKKNDTIVITDKHSDENWWSAQHYDNPKKKGMVPKNYIEMKPHKWYEGLITRKQAEEKLMQKNVQNGHFLLRDSESSPGDFSLSIRFKNQVQHFKILQEENKFHLWVVKFPSINKLIEYHKQSSVSPSDNIILKEGPIQVTCLFDFLTAAEGELLFRAGDMIEVLEKDDKDSWWKGRNQKTGETGLFPVNYVKEK
ncbi:growth factor receptor-bound protein 2-like [Ylistrum balloti]|uniref:growth factor receptor-bound protein 2-like n=1 Tax=Ylistrum balloti TaxID=509963 RepID=UPI002905DEF6|nr:growth factor receptor-bound protein 2-like [Ylistrum balloti]